MEMEDVETTVFEKLGQLDAVGLGEVCFHINNEEAEKYSGKRHALLKWLLRYLTSATVDESDNKEAMFRELLDFIGTVEQKQKVKNETPENIEKPDTKPTKFKIIKVVEPEPAEQPKIYQQKSKINPLASPFTPSFNFDQDEEKMRSIFMKELKISGKIGDEKSTKDSLSYSSLIFQIQNAQKRGYSNANIIDAVIKSITHTNPLRQYLEGRDDLTFADLSQILRYHFKEKDATSLFTSLSTAKQGSSETCHDFVLRLMNLRQKILFVSNEESGGYEYRFVQKRFLHAVLTGLRNENIRSELRSVLKDESTSDEALMSRVTDAVVEEAEHAEKLSSASRKTNILVNEIDSEKVRDDKAPKKNLLLDEMAALKLQVNQITNLLSAGGKVAPSSARGNPQQAAQSQRIPRCNECSKNKVDFCDHCFNCGSTEHLRAGCKKRRASKNSN